MDTVVGAGRYDGIFGILSPIACVADLHARGKRLRCTLEVVAFGDEEGNALGGHLNRGCTVFSIEVSLQELIGDPPVRHHDLASGLNLWCVTPPGDSAH